VCFRSNVWNIGAEGQFVIGAICAGGMALLADKDTGRWIVLAILLAGVLGGMLWAGITALLRDRFNASEILVSLMLVYVAVQVLGYWSSAPGRTRRATTSRRRAPSRPSRDSAPDGGLAREHRRADRPGGRRAAVAVPVRTARLCPAGGRAGAGGGALRRLLVARALWTALLISGGAAGLAGALEVAGPLGQLTPFVPAGYGFAAIIVAFVGRLHPVGMVLAAILMSMFYIGGELAQSRLGLPKSLTGVFQGLLLFSLLACDTLINYRIRRTAARQGAR
jgi:simple sugar transport system permease protein